MDDYQNGQSDPPPHTGPTMTTAEVCAYFTIHRSTLYRLVKAGKIPAYNIGSDYRFNREEIESVAVEAVKPAGAEEASN